MTARLADLKCLPGWPRCLSREQAAAYVGVSPNLFDAEVAAGLWPRGDRRGGKGGRVTWDRAAIDRRLDVPSGLAPELEVAGGLGKLPWRKS